MTILALFLLTRRRRRRGSGGGDSYVKVFLHNAKEPIQTFRMSGNQ
jgi:hypothetical protein